MDMTYYIQVATSFVNLDFSINGIKRTKRRNLGWV